MSEKSFPHTMCDYCNPEGRVAWYGTVSGSFAEAEELHGWRKTAKGHACPRCVAGVAADDLKGEQGGLFK